jgi:hypothetical protein
LLLTTEAMLAGLPQKNSHHLAMPAGMDFWLAPIVDAVKEQLTTP